MTSKYSRIQGHLHMHNRRSIHPSILIQRTWDNVPPDLQVPTYVCILIVIQIRIHRIFQLVIKSVQNVNREMDHDQHLPSTIDPRTHSNSAFLSTTAHRCIVDAPRETVDTIKGFWDNRFLYWTTNNQQCTMLTFNWWLCKWMLLHSLSPVGSHPRYIVVYVSTIVVSNLMGKGQV